MMMTPPVDAANASPEVSVIVPARNEEASLAACLESLVAQPGVSFEVIVVDDGSTDRTREVTQSFSRVTLIAARPLPPGWSGKSNAMFSGAQQARGLWLLFTDADTVHKQGSLARSLDEAKRFGVALLSYSPEQEVRGFWAKAVMAVIFGELACTYRPKEICDPSKSVAAANGQYMLIRRDTHLKIAERAEVHASLLEDVAVAKAVKQSGDRIRFRLAADAVRTRMYRNFAELRDGWTKNLALLFPEAGRLAVHRLFEFVAIVGGAAATVVLLVVGKFFLRSWPRQWPEACTARSSPVCTRRILIGAQPWRRCSACPCSRGYCCGRGVPICAVKLFGRGGRMARKAARSPADW